MTNSPAAASAPASPLSPARQKARQALLDAAQRLLITKGYARLTTRELAAEAGVNIGLIHYYFGSLEEVLFQALERYSDALQERQRALYAGPEPFLEKWRTATRYLQEDLAAGYPKVGFELAALGWNHPRFRERVAGVLGKWREIVTAALADAHAEHGLDERRFPVEGIASLIMTSQLGFMFESLLGIDEGHADLQSMMDAWIVEMSRGTAARSKPRTSKKGRKKGATSP
jgi:AcrR family transcriptional regulator